jgi:hypothetical protein
VDVTGVYFAAAGMCALDDCFLPPATRKAYYLIPFPTPLLTDTATANFFPLFWLWGVEYKS